MKLKNKIVYKICSDPVKWNILKLASKGLNISEISRELDIAYKNIHRHINNLVKENLIKVELQVKQKHKPAKIILDPQLKKQLKKISEEEEKALKVWKGIANSEIIKKTDTAENRKLILEILEKNYKGIANEKALNRNLTEFKDQKEIWFLIERMIYERLLERNIKITRLGKKYLKS